MPPMNVERGPMASPKPRGLWLALSTSLSSSPLSCIHNGLSCLRVFALAILFPGNVFPWVFVSLFPFYEVLGGMVHGSPLPLHLLILLIKSSFKDLFISHDTCHILLTSGPLHLHNPVLPIVGIVGPFSSSRSPFKYPLFRILSSDGQK